MLKYQSPNFALNGLSLKLSADSCSKLFIFILFITFLLACGTVYLFMYLVRSWHPAWALLICVCFQKMIGLMLL